MTDKDNTFALFFWIIMLVGGVSWIIGHAVGVSQTHKKAVKAGAAHYEASPEGDVLFKYNTEK